MTALLTAQIELTSLKSTYDTYNAYTGIGIGVITIILAIYIFFSLKISYVQKEHQVFKAKEDIYNKNHFYFIIVKSKIYPNYVYNKK